jgi:hypothetical protein
MSGFIECAIQDANGGLLQDQIRSAPKWWAGNCRRVVTTAAKLDCTSDVLAMLLDELPDAVRDEDNFGNAIEHLKNRGDDEQLHMLLTAVNGTNSPA